MLEHRVSTVVQNFSEGQSFWFVFVLLAIRDSIWDLVFHDQGWNLRPLQWKHKLNHWTREVPEGPVSSLPAPLILSPIAPSGMVAGVVTREEWGCRTEGNLSPRPGQME